MSDFDNLAKLIKEAAKVREESYDSEKRIEKYDLTIDQACEKVGKDLNLGFQHVSLASLMLFSYWNDALDWADKQIYPAEMAYVEACYRVANDLYDEDDNTPYSSLSQDQIYRLRIDFVKTAESTRKSLYGFGQD